MALQNDQRRGVFYATQQWLVATGQLDEKSDQLQGKVLPWLPAFQAEMIKHGVPESFFESFKSPQLTQIQQSARPMNHRTFETYSPEVAPDSFSN
eukprot:15471241-Alexandrium_andersonii.AAC.1